MMIGNTTRIKKIFAFGLITLVLTACGWRLRGTLDLPEGLSSVRVVSAVKADDFEKDLVKLLAANGVIVNPAGGEADIVIKLGKLEDDRRVASTGSNTLVTEYEINYELEFSIEDSSGVVLQAPDTLYSVRSYEVDQNTVASNAEEERLILKEMRRDLVEQIVRRLRFLNTGTSPSTNTSIKTTP